ncbi:MAG TPA: hypothetical protein VNS32_28225 [Flavisolibacter sp.]|nr:hypothetical protein [Flavisolibacter sp.]
MTDEQTFNTNSLFQSVSYDNGAEAWSLFFAENISFNISGFWRLLKNDEIWLVSFDHGHKFGRDVPVNTVEEAENLLTGQRLTKIEIKQGTGDLVLELTDGIKIQAFISSTGYETYDFNYGNKRFIGMGSGDIAIFSI